MVIKSYPERNRQMHIRDTEFWGQLMHDVFGPREGGAIIFLDAENARKGIAKTSAAVAFGRLIAKAFDYELDLDDALLAGPKYIRRYREHPGKDQPSVLIADELVGGGAGDSRRAMSQANINIGRAFQLLRKKRVVTITTLPDWNDADSRLQKAAAYRIQCLERPIGTFKAYKINTTFADSSGGGIRTPGLGPDGQARRINFPDMTAVDDPLYERLEQQKDELLDQEEFAIDAIQGEDDEEDDTLSEDDIRRQERIETAIRLYQPWSDDIEHSYEDVARSIPEFGREWVGQRVREWKAGEHREIVDDPTE